jgi:penicillin amidase
MRHTLVVSVSLMLLSSIAATMHAQTADELLQKARGALAMIDGEKALPGLKEAVEVLRDRWGIPHIYARNSDDLFFAQGFVAAQDRLFQLDMWRRLAAGETAEVMGRQALDADRFARLLRYRGDMEREWSSYSPDTRQIAVAFTAGINACIDQAGKRLPIEFQILGIEPGKWRPEDILGRMSGIIMTRNFQQEVARARLIAAVGVDKARWLAPTDPAVPFAPAPGLDLGGIDQNVLAGYAAATKVLQFQPAKNESNNWVVSGKRSISGKPLLASDPHRPIALPALRYLVHLNAPAERGEGGWNVIGSGEPGLPGVAIGHNERIAWGITIVGTDQADLFVEDTDPVDPARYKSEGGYERFRIIKETIKVKGEPQPVEVELRFSRHGPVIYQDLKRHRAYALKWVGSEPGGAAYLGSLAIDRARNWPEFLKALQAWKGPSENFVYADVDGNIGWVAAALSPVRRDYDGLLPVPGNAGHEWKGFLAVKDLPTKFNPPAGFIATANHNILPAGYKHPINFDWAPGYRFARLHQRLESKDKFTLADFQDMQHDSTSFPGQVLVRLVKTVDMQDAALAPYAKLLASWDGVLSMTAAAGPLHAAWMLELQDAFYLPHIPKDLLPAIRTVLNARVMLTALENPDRNWFGDDPIAGRDRLLRSTFAAAVAKLKMKLGLDVDKWSWGKLHTVTFRHPLAKLGTAYEKAFNLGPVGRPGDALTPLNTKHDEKFQQVHGATYRHVLDLADWDRGLATSAPGQSGQPGSPHYGDLLPLWAEGRYFPLAFSRKRVEEVTAHRLRLTPAP